MNVKGYLLQYADLKRKADRYRERIANIENTLKGVNLDGMPRGTTPGDPTKNAALNLALLKEQLKDASVEAEQMAQEISENIEKMPTAKYKELLFDRYILFMTWEKVSTEMNYFRNGREYEVKHVTGYMHSQALRELEEVLLNENK